MPRAPRPAAAGAAGGTASRQRRRHRLPAGSVGLARAPGARPGSPAGSGRRTCATVNDPWGLALTLGPRPARVPVPGAGDPGRAEPARRPAGSSRSRARLATAPARPGSSWCCPCCTGRSGCRSTPCSRSPSRSSTWRWCWGRQRHRRWRCSCSAGCSDPDPRWHPVGAAGAMLQLGADRAGAGRRGAWARSLVGASAAAGWSPARRRALERALARLAAWHDAGWCSAWASRAGRPCCVVGRRHAGAFPAAWPQDLTLASWAWAASGLAAPTRTTLLVGIAAAAIALVAVLACLEHETRAGAPAGDPRPGPGLPAAAGAADQLPVRAAGAVRPARARCDADRAWSGRTSSSCCPTSC